MIYLHKILPLLFSPLTLLLTASLFYSFKKRIWQLGLASLIVVLFSLEVTPYYLWKALELDTPPVMAADLEEADAIVVLSGMVGIIHLPHEKRVQWGPADRFFKGVKLKKINKAKKLIFTGGALSNTAKITEGEILKKTAIEMGIPSHEIFVTPFVKNTAEEAIAVRSLTDSGARRIILVTSSFHMKRATLLFEQQGFSVSKFPADIKIGSRSPNFNLLSFVPSTSSLHSSFEATREYLGRTYYTLRTYFKI